MGTDRASALADPVIKREMADALGIAHISDNTARILQLHSKGIALEDAHRLITGKERLPDSTKTNLKKKSEKWLLNSPQMQKLAHNAVKETLQMKPIETEKGPIYPRVSDRLAAASMVTDRVEPVKGQQGQGTINLFIDKVQVNQFQAPDVVSHETMDNDQIIECNDIRELSQE